MTEYQLLLLLAGIFVFSFVALWATEAFGFYRKYHGERLITCPETKKTEAVKIAMGKAAMKAVIEPELRLSDCTRWPERSDCGQYCLSQIEEAPEECLVSHIVAEWYEGRACVYCGRPFSHLEWHDHKPALLAPDGAIVSLRDLPAQKLPELFRTHSPVCWKCCVAENFRHEHAEIVTDRREH